MPSPSPPSHSHSHTRSRPPSPPVPPLLRQPSADIILLTSDRPPLELRVHRRILIEASDFFRSMFSLPQPSPSTKGKAPSSHTASSSSTPPLLSEDDLPRIEMSDPASHLIPLLTLLYPVPPPSLSSLSLLPPLLRLSQKYDLPSPLSHLRSLLILPHFLLQDPLAVYAIACEFSFLEEAKQASRQTLKMDLMSLLLPLPDKLGQMLAVDLVQLVALRVARASQAKALIKSPELFSSFRCPCGLAPPWVGEWKRRACLELDRYPVGDTIFSSGFLGEVMSEKGARCGQCGVGRWDAGEWERVRARVDGLADSI